MDKRLGTLLLEKREQILKLASDHGIKEIKLFGSVARGEDNADSDVDFLVTFEQGRSLLDLCGFRLDVKDLLGREVDVLTENGLYRHIRQQVLAEAKPL